MYSELAEKTSRELTHSVNEWCLFLKSQAKLYKYPYADQLMIYAQRPDASLCLTFDEWTQTMNRYIHKGAKGIGLVDYTGDTPKMKYVFDISDTSERYNSRASAQSGLCRFKSCYPHQKSTAVAVLFSLSLSKKK